MASWVTHFMIADEVIKQFPNFDRRGFCVGNIAPDCNVENENWTEFTPPREVTHWMNSERKVLADCDGFYKEYVLNRKEQIRSNEQYSFLLGYYTHLIVDAEFQRFIRDEKRVADSWVRIKENSKLCVRVNGETQDFDGVKKIMPTKERMHEIYSMEAEYLQEHPDSGYLKEIMTLKEFPDYIDYLPQGCIVRKISVMGYVPKVDLKLTHPIAISREEFQEFAKNTAKVVVAKLSELGV